jgi:hypothetical protein
MHFTSRRINMFTKYPVLFSQQTLLHCSQGPASGAGWSWRSSTTPSWRGYQIVVYCETNVGTISFKLGKAKYEERNVVFVFVTEWFHMRIRFWRWISTVLYQSRFGMTFSSALSRKQCREITLLGVFYESKNVQFMWKSCLSVCDLQYQKPNRLAHSCDNRHGSIKVV